MGRIISLAAAELTASLLAGLPALPGQLPIFGRGRYRVFLDGGSFTPLVSGPHRIRALGAGGDATVDGGTSSFANLLSATGGRKPSGLVGGLGGIGVGGSLNAAGGAGGAGVAEAGGGGGGAGSQLGDGGAGGAGFSYADNGTRRGGGGGGAVGGFKGGVGAIGNPLGGGASPIADAKGSLNAPGYTGRMGYSSGLELLDSWAAPYFQFTGGAAQAPNGYAFGGQGGQGATSYNGQSGYFTSASGTNGGPGGGGGGGVSSGGGHTSLRGGGQGGGQGLGGGGGGGFAMGVFDLDLAQTYGVTVGASSAPGLIIVEW